MVTYEQIPQDLAIAELTPQQRIEAFQRGVGIRYGLVFGALYASALWVYDSLSLGLSLSDGFWFRAALGIPIALVVCVVAGWLAARPQPAWMPYAIWSGALVLLTVAAAHIPFEGVTALVGFLEPSVSELNLFPFGVSAEYRMVLLAVLSVILGVLAAFLQQLAEGWAWDRSSADNRMTPSGWLSLILFALPVLILGYATDGLINSPLRESLQEVHETVMYILSAPHDPQALMRNGPRSGIPYYSIALNRDRFTENFTQYLVSYDVESLATAQVDVVFDNRFMLRCDTNGYGEFITACTDLLKDRLVWMNELMSTGDLACGNCSVEVNAPTRRWLAERLPTLPPEFTLSARHGEGPIIYMIASFEPSRAIECRFRGQHPTLVDLCRDVP